MGKEIVAYLFLAIIVAGLVIHGDATNKIIGTGGTKLNDLAKTLTGGANISS